MVIGTAGLTAALAIERLERMGQTPDLGPMLVTGATGGVGSLAIDMLAARGYEVVALTAKNDERDFLETLGAARIIDRKTLQLGTKPLEKAEFGGGIDTLGGDILAWLARSTRPRGSIAVIGLARSAELNMTVLPLILRGVSLLGINSVALHPELRSKIWTRLASDLRPPHLDVICTSEVALDDVSESFDVFIQGRIVGRTVVRVHEHIRSGFGQR